MFEVKSIEDFDNILKKEAISIGYFTTTGCNVCKALLPKFEEKFDLDYSIFKTNLTNLQELAGRLTIFSVPTVIIFIEGKESHRFTRSFSLEEVSEKVERFKELMS